MDTKKIVLSKDFVKRKKFLKNEIKKIIFKSIFRNFQINDVIRIEMLRKLTFIDRKSSISKQNNICMITGRFGGIFKKFTMSRHTIKRFAKINMLANIKIKSW